MEAFEKRLTKVVSD